MHDEEVSEGGHRKTDCRRFWPTPGSASLASRIPAFVACVPHLALPPDVRHQAFSSQR